MSEPLRLPAELPPAERRRYELPDEALARRRRGAVRVRRRRLLAADLAIGAALALIGLLLAPGLAILALAAILALCACAAWSLGELVRARRARRRARPTRARPQGTTHPSVER